MTTPPEPPLTDPTTFVARSATDLIAVVPAVLGFHPQDSVVLLTFGPPDGAFHARVDLPVASAEQAVVADLLVDAVVANGVRRVAVLLYTDDAEAAHAQAAVLLRRLLALQVEVVEVVRVDGGCWHPVPDDGSPGTAFELETHPFTAQRVFEGHVVHRDREELADSLVGTDEDDALEVALAAMRFADLVVGARGGDAPVHAFLRTEAGWLQRRVRSRLADQQLLDPHDAGRLLVLVSLEPVRTVALAQIDRAGSGPHVDLWRELVRRGPRELLPGAASLLAFAAWQHGDGALAWCAIDRCLEVDPDHPLAHQVADFLTRAVPPGAWPGVGDAWLSLLEPDPTPDGHRDLAS